VPQKSGIARPEEIEATSPIPIETQAPGIKNLRDSHARFRCKDCQTSNCVSFDYTPPTRRCRGVETGVANWLPLPGNVQPGFHRSAPSVKSTLSLIGPAHYSVLDLNNVQTGLQRRFRAVPVQLIDVTGLGWQHRLKNLRVAGDFKQSWSPYGMTLPQCCGVSTFQHQCPANTVESAIIRRVRGVGLIRPLPILQHHGIVAKRRKSVLVTDCRHVTVVRRSAAWYRRPTIRTDDSVARPLWLMRARRSKARHEFFCASNNW